MRLTFIIDANSRNSYTVLYTGTYYYTYCMCTRCTAVITSPHDDATVAAFNGAAALEATVCCQRREILRDISSDKLQASVYYTYNENTL